MILVWLPKFIELGILSTAEVNSVSAIGVAEGKISEVASTSLSTG